MTLQPDQSLNAKILLFGEHTLMLNSMALSIPFERFRGKLLKDPQLAEHPVHFDSNEQINKFYAFLKDKSQHFTSPFTLHIETLGKDLHDGLYFESNIPHGYGLGSSGALVAALFRRYGTIADPDYFIRHELLPQLKAFFASLESYFHGTSSGLDPLISFLNQAVIIRANNQPETIHSHWTEHKGPGAVFIIDSRISGDTQPLVEYFRARYNEPGFRQEVDNYYIPLVNKAVGSYISGEPSGLIKILAELSAFQLNRMTRMIPEEIHAIWQLGLDEGAFALKLCGSGGGGMVLGFTDKREIAMEQLARFNPMIIHQL